MKCCDKEQDVFEALQSGRLASEWGEPLRRHIAECANCADLALVAEFMQEESDLTLAHVKVPSAALVWWKAQLRARREAAQQALRPVRIAERVGLGSALLGVLAVLVWLGDFAGINLPSGWAMAGGTVILCATIFGLYVTLAKKHKRA